MEKPKNQRKMNSPTCIQPRVIPEPGKAGVYTNQLHFIQKQVLGQLPKKKYAEKYLKPVDTKEMNLPNYYVEMKLLMECYNEHPPVDQASEELYRANISKAQDKLKDFNAALFMQLALRNIPIPDHVPNEIEVNAVDLISPDALALLLDTTLAFDIIGGNN